MRKLPEHWFHILLAVADESRHGLGIIQEVSASTDGEVRLWPGMLYVALRRLRAAGFVEESEAPAAFESGGGRPRFYRITAAGRKASAEEAKRLARIVDAARAKRILRGT